MIVYLHGFRSSPASHKARCLEQYLRHRGLGAFFWCEALPTSPPSAIERIESVILAQPTPPTLVGSSLGGLYAAVVGQRHGCKSVLINPAVVASLTLEPYLGEQTCLHSGQRFTLGPADLAALKDLEAEPIKDPSAIWLLLETGDEVLDYRVALNRYSGAKQTVVSGGDHSFTRFADYLDEIASFAGLSGGLAEASSAPRFS